MIKELFDAYGRTITVLRTHPLLPRQEVLDRCPVLEHLAAHSNLESESLTHQTVKFIDVFISCQDPPFITVGVKDAFPALQGCRNLEVKLIPFREIPLQRDENESQATCGNAEDGVSDCDEQDSDLQETKDVLTVLAAVSEFTDPSSVNGAAFTRNDTSDDYYFNLDDGDEGSSDGSDYVFNSTDDDEGSDSSNSDAGSCITVSEDEFCLQDEFYMQEYWEVGRDEALAIFDRTHDL
jgi:hypothetical protein